MQVIHVKNKPDENFHISQRYLNGFHHVNELWIPEIYDDGDGVASVASANLALQIYGNGSVLYTVRYDIGICGVLSRERNNTLDIFHFSRTGKSSIRQ